MGVQMLKMRYVLPLVVGLGPPVLACDYCSAEVTLTSELAECYLQRVDVEINQMLEANLPAQLINLASCDGAETATRGTSTLPGVSPGEKKPDLSFLMDAAGLRCLASELQAATWSPDPIKTFEVRRDCEAR